MWFPRPDLSANCDTAPPEAVTVAVSDGSYQPISPDNVKGENDDASCDAARRIA
jgi:hypothetical protein